ncbi:MAG: phage/plasmid primase, P4 family [Candidatus Heimdallarchaeota archaeon]
MLVPGAFKDEKGKISPGLIAGHITDPTNSLRQFFKSFEDTEEIVVYQNGVYKPHGEVKIREIAEELIGVECSNHMRNEVVGHIRSSSYAPREMFDSEPNTINLLNGFLNIKTLELEPHDPDILSMKQIPVNFAPEVTCPTIDTCLEEWVHPEAIPLLEEMLGYLLLNDCRYAKSFWLVGDGENGKSTFLDLIIAFLGKENCSSVSVQQLCDNQFAAAQLFGKMANIFADLPKNALQETSMFKTMVVGDTILANPKYGKQFSFRNTAKMIYSCNALPDTDDQTRAFFRRVEIINFANVFPPETADKELLSRLTVPSELSGLLNRALAGLHRLFENGCFSSEYTVERLQEQWERLANPPMAFIEDWCELVPDESEEKAEFYQLFRQWCEKNNTAPNTYRAFNSYVKHTVGLKEARLGSRGNRKLCWQGIHCIKRDTVSGSRTLKEHLQLPGDKNVVPADTMTRE